MLKELTHEETLDRIQAFQSEFRNGNWDAAIKIAQESFPLPADVAKAAYVAGGKDFVLNLGYDLSEAEAVYGSDWLDK